MSANSQTLPPREASLFKKILKHFKDKQFKSGLKVANQILSNPKFSEHGETLSMKGLILNSMGKRTEAFEYVKRGLKNDVKSHVCWHVFGLLQKADHKYEEAIKCYRNALRLKKDSVQILSDLSLVQIQTRDLEGYRDSRYQLFLLRPGERSTWIGCAMAYHLTGDHVTAVNILSEYQKTNASTGNFRRNNRRHNEAYEHSELLLYNISILIECGRYDEALSLLNESESEIVDKMSYYEFKCEIYLALGKFKDAQKIVHEQLISRNPENARYCELLEKANHITDEVQRIEVYDHLAESYPRSQTISRLPLNFVSDLQVFTQKMDSYLQRGFRKGQPALFRDLKHLYNAELANSDYLNTFTYSKLEPKSFSSKITRAELEAYLKKIRRGKLPSKVEAIENLLLSYVDNLKARNSFDTQSSDTEAITCLLWVYYFLAQHFDALKEFGVALYFVNSALVHTPTLIDIFVIKAKIFKHAGFPEKAAKYLEEAQSLDTSDRYLNSKCAKYLIRINKIKEAEEMCLKFTREGVPAVENLNEMQCMWFLTEMTSAYQRMNMLGEALKKCIEVDNHFAEINEDQFDFNTYCMLKVTLRAYVQMIRLEDQLKSHRFFLKSAKSAIEIYLRLYDKPVSNKSETNDESDSQLSASELRKMRNKQRKAQLKAEKENEKAQKKLNNEKRDNESKSEFAEVVDVAKLEKSETPLDDVMRFLTPCKFFGRHLLETHLLAFEVYFRKGKILLQLQSLKRASRMCSPNSKHYPTLLRQLCLFLNQLHCEQLHQSIRFVLSQELPALDVFGLKPIGGDQVDILSKLPTTEAFMAKHLAPNSKSFQIRVEHMKVKHYLAEQQSNTNSNDSTASKQLKSATEYTESILSSLVPEMDQLSDLTLENSLALYNAVKSSGFGQVNAQTLEQLRQKLHTLYPYASRFMVEKEIQELENDLLDSDFFTAETEDFTANSNPTEE